jgi:hypothetical protein
MDEIGLFMDESPAGAWRRQLSLPAAQRFRSYRSNGFGPRKNPEVEARVRRQLDHTEHLACCALSDTSEELAGVYEVLRHTYPGRSTLASWCRFLITGTASQMSLPLSCAPVFGES